MWIKPRPAVGGALQDVMYVGAWSKNIHVSGTCCSKQNWWGRKISLLTHKWIKHKGHGSWLGYNMERQQELQVNTTNITKMKKTAHIGAMANVKHRHGGGEQLQSRDVFVKYKHNLVGVKEQLNWLHIMGKWTWYDKEADISKNCQEIKFSRSSQSKIIMHFEAMAYENTNGMGWCVSADDSFNHVKSAIVM